MGSLLLAVASGFLGGIVVLASGVGLARVRRMKALRVFGAVLLLLVVALSLVSGIVFVWLAMLTHAPTVSAFTLGASFGAAVGVAVALVVGVSLVAWLFASPPARSAGGMSGAYGGAGHAQLGRRMGRW